MFAIKSLGKRYPLSTKLCPRLEIVKNNLCCSVNFDEAREQQERLCLGKSVRKCRGIFQFQMKIAFGMFEALGGALRRMAVKEQIRRQKLQIVMVQETKLNEVSDSIVKQIWGKRYVKWEAVGALGLAGGMSMGFLLNFCYLSLKRGILSVSTGGGHVE